MVTRSRTREKVMRILLAALLDSSLSAGELAEIAEELSASPKFSWDLGELLRDVLGRLDMPVSGKMSNRDRNTLDALAYSVISRRRLSKQTVIELMNAASGRKYIELMNSNQTTRELLNKFFNSASISEIRKFMEMLENPSKDDPYLQGITKRS